MSGAEQRRAKRAGVQRRRTVSTDLHVTKTASVGGVHVERDLGPVNVLKRECLGVSFNLIAIARMEIHLEL